MLFDNLRAINFDTHLFTNSFNFCFAIFLWSKKKKRFTQFPKNRIKNIFRSLQPGYIRKKRDRDRLICFDHTKTLPEVVT